MLFDSLLHDKCNTTKVNPNGLYTDTDRVLANPDNFDKGNTIMLMVGQDGFCGGNETFIYDGKNGKKSLTSNNFYASWMNLSWLHTHFAHSIDDTDSVFDREGLSPVTIMSYVDLHNNGVIFNELQYATMQRIPDSYFNANPYRGLLIAKTASLSIETAFNVLELGIDTSNRMLDNLYAVKLEVNGVTVKCTTESAEFNLLTGKAKFNLKSKPIL